MNGSTVSGDSNIPAPVYRVLAAHESRVCGGVLDAVVSPLEGCGGPGEARSPCCAGTKAFATDAARKPCTSAPLGEHGVKATNPLDPLILATGDQEPRARYALQGQPGLGPHTIKSVVADVIVADRAEPPSEA